MSNSTPSRWTACLTVVLACLALPLIVLAADSSAAELEDGITRPSETVDFQFNQPGLIKEVNVKDGAVVKKGDVMVAQDTSVEEAALAAMKYEANSTVKVEAAQAEMENKKIELDRKRRLLDQQNIGKSEYDEAVLAVKIGELSVKLAEEDRQKKQLDISEQKAKIALKKMVATLDGIVQKLEAHPGQNADPSKPQLTVVQNDPLWVDVHIPWSRAKSLKEKQSLQVRYKGDEKWQAGEVIFLDPVIDAQSDTQLVRLEIPNPSGRKAGLHVDVRLGENVASAGRGSD